MTWMDHALVLTFAAVWPAWAYRDYPRFKARVRAGVPGARLATYADSMITQWLLVTVTAALWIHLDRDWTWIGLSAPGSRDSYLALGAAAAIGAFLFIQSATVARRPETHEQVRGALARIADMLPVHRSDLTGFIALSITAGICEEILFRGLLGWYLGNWLGAWAAQAVALAIFGAAHLHLGAAVAVRALLMGAVLAGLYLWSGSLVPSMLLHVMVDVSSGWMAYEVLRERGSAAAGYTSVGRGERI